MAINEKYCEAILIEIDKNVRSINKQEYNHIISDTFKDTQKIYIYMFKKQVKLHLLDR